MMYIHHMARDLARSGRTPPTTPAQTTAPQAIVEVCLCHHTRRAARAISRVFDEALHLSGLKASQFNILAAIAARELTSAAEIARLLAMDRTTLSRNLMPLRKAGYLSTGGGAGRRPDRLELTGAGRTVLARAVELWRGAQSQLTERMGAGQAGQLLRALEAATKAAE